MMHGHTAIKEILKQTPIFGELEEIDQLRKELNNSISDLEKTFTSILNPPEEAEAEQQQPEICQTMVLSRLQEIKQTFRLAIRKIKLIQNRSHV